MEGEEWRQEAAVGFRVYEKSLSTFADVGKAADRNAQEVGGDGQGCAVEVAAR